MEDVLGVDDVAATGGKLCALKANKTVWNVHQGILCPFVAKKFHNLENLGKVELLLLARYIETFVEIICFFAVEDGGQISCCVDGAAVFFCNDTWGHVVFGQVHNHGAFAFFQESGRCNSVHNALTFVTVKAFAQEVVEVHAKKVVGALVLDKADVLKPLPNGQGLLVAGFHFGKPCASLVHKGWLFVGFVVEFHVKLHKLCHAVCLHGFLAAPIFVGNNKLAKLRAPVTKMVDADHVVAKLGIYFVKGISDDSCAKVTNVEVLGHIW